MPHITDAIQEWIERAAAIPVDGKDGPADVCVIELGGTIGNLVSPLKFDQRLVISVFFFFFFPEQRCLLQGILNQCPLLKLLDNFPIALVRNELYFIIVSMLPVNHPCYFLLNDLKVVSLYILCSPLPCQAVGIFA